MYSTLRRAMGRSCIAAGTPCRLPPPHPCNTFPDMPPAPPRILISDDQPDVLEALRLLLKPEGLHTETVTSPAGALTALQERDFDVLLMDLNYTRDTTSGTEGLELLAKAQSIDPTLPIIVMTAWGSIESAVEAMRRGARDYVEKPWDNARLLTTLRTQLELGKAIRATQRLETENSRLRRDGLPVMFGESRAMQPVRRLLEKIAPSDANVLVTGDHGTGKEVVARWLHAASPRAGKPLVTVNAGGLSEGVVESELFGHVRGRVHRRQDRSRRLLRARRRRHALPRRDRQRSAPAAGEAPARARERRAAARRLVADTPRGRARASPPRTPTSASVVAEKRFREDLLYRLNTVEIRLPPLQDRREDIALLAKHFLAPTERSLRQAGARLLRRRHARAPRPLRGPATCASSSTWSSAPCCSRPARRAALDDLELRAKADAGPGVDDMTLEDAERWLITACAPATRRQRQPRR